MDSPAKSKEYSINGLHFVAKVVILYVFLFASLHVPPLFGIFKRGLFCNDESIRYNYHSNTISASVLMIYGIGLTILSVILVEVYHLYIFEKSKQLSKYKWKNINIPIIFVRIVKYFGYSQIGFVVNVALNVITKHFIGRLRPNFWEVCKLAEGTCSVHDPYKYIAELNCTGNPEAVDDARKSFYSGHSAAALYSAVWSALYIQARISKSCKNGLFVPFIQTLLIISGLAISFSRISDNKHHWSDVLVGILVGTFIAIYNCVFWSKLFEKNDEDKERNETHTIKEVQSRVTLNTEVSRDSNVSDPTSVRTMST